MFKVYFKYTLLIVFVFVLGITLHQLFTSHRSDFNTISRKYLYFFKDSALNNLDTISSSSFTDSDVLNDYIFNTNKNKYFITIWEFKTLHNFLLSEVVVNKVEFVGNSKFILQETPGGWGSTTSISIKYLYEIDGISLNISTNSKVISNLEGKYYKGFYGLMDKMSLIDKDGDAQVYFNFVKYQTPTILLFYKKHKNLFIILINSKNEFDKNIINILNLE